MTEPTTSRPRILLVDDEDAMRKVVADLLVDEYEVETAADGEQALIAVLRARPDLIITDIVMPLLDGVELVRVLRDTPSTSNIPVLLTSGRAPDELRIEGLEVGADSYLAKPYSGRELRARIRNILQGNRRRDEAARLEALEQVAAERAALLERMKEAERRKDEFVATLAHELRNPLAPIRNGIHLLKSGVTGPDGTRVLEMMDRQMSHMVRLLDDLLDLSRITRGRLELKRETVHMKDVLAAAIESTQSLIEARNHQLVMEINDAEAKVDGDPTRLAQIFANLVSNAAKYTDPGGRIGVTLSREGGECVVMVADNGIGIPPQALGQLFEMFSQVRLQQQHEEAGLGIGLSVVRTLVQMHGGTVAAFSDGPGSGSTFVVRLPLVMQPGEDTPSVPVEIAGPGHAGKILVVDDNRDAAQTMAYLLQADGHVVKTAYGGEEAVMQAAEFRPDLIFMDLGMPQVDGYEATRRIRAQSGDRRPRIIALTGWGQTSDRQRASDAGMDGHLVKPADPREVREVISRCQGMNP